MTGLAHMFFVYNDRAAAFDSLFEWNLSTERVGGELN